MNNKIVTLPITIDREVKFYIVETHPSPIFSSRSADCPFSSISHLGGFLNEVYGTLALTSQVTYPDLERNVILTTDGSNVEFWDGFIVDERRPPLDSLRIDLHITFKELFMTARTPRMFVDLIMVGCNKIRVIITTPHDTVYDRIHWVD